MQYLECSVKIFNLFSYFIYLFVCSCVYVCVCVHMHILHCFIYKRTTGKVRSVLPLYKFKVLNSLLGLITNTITLRGISSNVESIFLKACHYEQRTYL